jgi:hypothetical protein
VRAKAGEDAGDKAGSGGGVLLVAAGAENFVHRAEREAALRQGAVDRGDAERQYAMLGWPFEPPDPIAKRIEAFGVRHAVGKPCCFESEKGSPAHLLQH